MFEQSVLDNSRQKRSKWSWMGLVFQLGAVTAMLLVPMVSPEILSVMMPKALIYVPVKPIAPVEVEVQHSSARSGSQNTVAVPRPAYKPFTAPTGRINPIADIVDGADFAPPTFSFGPPVVSANGPFAPSSIPTAPPPTRPEPVKTPPAKPVPVGGDVLAAKALSQIKPTYPALAKQARISGLVKLEGIIAKDGTVQLLKVISGHPLLAPAAVEAVKQWRYRPTLLNGQPVEVIAPIDVNFILSR
ncbi:MAG: TonB family protein [Acidobacteria bacterium]|nr:TonB family protein [Acidobacteriota bacterium]